MKILILNGSPRKKGSTSGYLAKMLRILLCGHSVKICSIISDSENEIFNEFNSIDSLIISLPLYVDGMPSHVTGFLKNAEKFCKENSCNFNVYAVSNNGFIEGRQNSVQLDQFHCWCNRAGLEWSGGIGIGGGEMLRVISLIYPCLITLNFLAALFWLAKGAQADLQLFSQVLQNLGIFVFFCFHFWFNIAALSVDIRKKRKAKKNRFTRIFVPALLFIVFADIFMVISSFFNGCFIFMLLGKDKYDKK